MDKILLDILGLLSDKPLSPREIWWKQHRYGIDVIRWALAKLADIGKAEKQYARYPSGVVATFKLAEPTAAGQVVA